MCAQTKSELAQGTTIQSGVCLTGSKCPVICGASEIVDWFEATAKDLCAHLCDLDKLYVWCTERCKQVGVAADKIGEVSVICIAAGSRDRKVRNVQQS